MHASKFLGVLLGLVSVPVASVMAQAAAYAQCGGDGYTGPTTCISGWTCVYSNQWYSQCLQSTAAATTSTKTTTSSASTSTTSALSTLCGQWDNIQTSNGYILYNNLWGMSAATSGSQCTYLLGTSGTSISWKTKWSWAGGQYNVKSFANANLIFTPKKLSAITSIPSTVKYTYTGTSGAVCNVAYDMFTHTTSGSSVSEYEIMVWLAAIGGAGPISSTGSPIASNLSLAGQTWNLYYGPNGDMKVYSFVATSGVVNNFSGDAKAFLTYLVNNQGLPSSQYLNTVQCGTEPFVGTNAELTVSAFSVAVN